MNWPSRACGGIEPPYSLKAFVTPRSSGGVCLEPWKCTPWNHSNQLLLCLHNTVQAVDVSSLGTFTCRKSSRFGHRRLETADTLRFSGIFDLAKTAKRLCISVGMGKDFCLVINSVRQLGLPRLFGQGLECCESLQDLLISGVSIRDKLIAQG